MPAATPPSLSPRKKPRQARAAVTLDAVYEASIQLLVGGGVARLTTTRVAERAGVSVGTMYQYFPHKQALIYALNERYLEALAIRLEAVCESHHGSSLGDMCEALIETYFQAKTERADVTRALYASVVELDNGALVANFADRADACTKAMLASASDATIPDLETVSLALLTTIFGAVRNAFERNLDAGEIAALKRQIIVMCRAYLEAVAGATNTKSQ
ncbi:MAG: TetR family transcriptional regulator [Martelella sp.]|uniref:TetR/AcrR family transcriptional regulator n=1 Tax=unclassified Martelella TaxID=2629616 RepID=UPI000C5200A1|nr:TetR/AcrR family transcriptional regulator [Martelella sp.]MAU19579.1 TetR family transcriptional regulator [Martelella sp.]